MKIAHDLLRRMTTHYPPPPGRHHALLISDVDPDGLVLGLQTEDGPYSLNLDAPDLLKGCEALANEVIAVIDSARSG